MPNFKIYFIMILSVIAVGNSILFKNYSVSDISNAVTQTFSIDGQDKVFKKLVPDYIAGAQKGFIDVDLLPSSKYLCLYIEYYAILDNSALRTDNLGTPSTLMNPYFVVKTTYSSELLRYKLFAKNCFNRTDTGIRTIGLSTFSGDSSTGNIFLDIVIVHEACPQTCKTCETSGFCSECYPGYPSSFLEIDSATGKCTCFKPSTQNCRLMEETYQIVTPCTITNILIGNSEYYFCKANTPPTTDKFMILPFNSANLSMSNIPIMNNYCIIGEPTSSLKGNSCSCELPEFVGTLSPPQNGLIVKPRIIAIPNTSPTQFNLNTSFDGSIALAEVDFRRHYMQVSLTDSQGIKKVDNGVVIQGTKVFSNQSSLTISPTQVTNFCDQIDVNNPQAGYKCYFLAEITDGCPSFFRVIYYHLKEVVVIIDGNYVYIKIESNIDNGNLILDPCAENESCYISSRYDFVGNFCVKDGIPCEIITYSNFKFRRFDKINVQISFTDKALLPVVAQNFVYESIQTVLVNQSSLPIAGTTLNFPFPSTPLFDGNKALFSFYLTDNYLAKFLDKVTYPDARLVLVVIVKVRSTSLRRYLDVEKLERISQNGQILYIPIDLQQNEQPLFEEFNYKDIKLTLIIFVCLLILLIGVIVLTLIYYVLSNKNKNNCVGHNKGSTKKIKENRDVNVVVLPFLEKKQNIGLFKLLLKKVGNRYRNLNNRLYNNLTKVF